MKVHTLLCLVGLATGQKHETGMHGSHVSNQQNRNHHGAATHLAHQGNIWDRSRASTHLHDFDKASGGPQPLTAYAVDGNGYLSALQERDAQAVVDKLGGPLNKKPTWIVDWWNYNKYNNGKQLLFPQTLRGRCNMCQGLISPWEAFGPAGRFAPDLTNGAPNLFPQQYLESYKMEWILKRCPTYINDACWKPHGHGWAWHAPCPASHTCSYCLGIPLQYCVAMD